jgi:hypothetical protein
MTTTETQPTTATATATTANKIVLSKGNMKLKDTLIFNLPTVKTCPFATEACKAFCYAQKPERQYETTRQARERHMNATLQDDFVDQMINAIGKANKNGKYKYFRIHESGDFYNQRYVNDWKKIASHFPNIIFLAYTKSYPFDFTAGTPTNLIVRYSIDSTSKAVRMDLPLAIVKDTPDTTTRTKTFACKPGMKCDTCRVCWTSQVDVSFEIH